MGPGCLLRGWSRGHGTGTNSRAAAGAHDRLPVADPDAQTSDPLRRKRSCRRTEPNDGRVPSNPCGRPTVPRHSRRRDLPGPGEGLRPVRRPDRPEGVVRRVDTAGQRRLLRDGVALDLRGGRAGGGRVGQPRRSPRRADCGVVVGPRDRPALPVDGDRASRLLAPPALRRLPHPPGPGPRSETAPRPVGGQHRARSARCRCGARAGGSGVPRPRPAAGARQPGRAAGDPGTSPRSSRIRVRPSAAHPRR